VKDNDVIKGLECCKGISMCDLCPYLRKCGKLTEDALELINRQTAEIEALTNTVDKGIEACHECHGKYAVRIETAKAEAIKDFAEEFKKRCIASGIYPAVTKNILKNLVKEMTEGGTDGGN
jgi:hypothetical protein